MIYEVHVGARSREKDCWSIFFYKWWVGAIYEDTISLVYK